MFLGLLVGQRRLSDSDQRPVSHRRAQERLLRIRVVDGDVDQLPSAAFEVVDCLPDVVRLEGDVVEALAVALEEAGQETVCKRLQQPTLPPPGNRS